MEKLLSLITSPDAWASLAALTTLEIVLGIDNVIFISIMADRLPPEKRDKGRKLGLLGALVTRLMLLCFASWIVTLKEPLVTLFESTKHPIALSGKAIILLLGGLFLLYKATKEIHDKLEGEEHGHGDSPKARTMLSVIAMIMVIDIVFSIDSVITAVGMARELAVMILANLIALGVMLCAAGFIARFVEQHPSVKMLALSFLLLIGFSLIVEGLGFHVPKGYIYFAMGFSVFVQFLNIRSAQARKPVALKSAAPVGLKKMMGRTQVLSKDAAPNGGAA